MWAVLSGKSRKISGVRRWPPVRNDILRTLKEGRYCTTMFDLYGMPHDWPGRATAGALPWNERSVHVEGQILADVTAQLGSEYDAQRFVPYVQLHEFESLVFADTTILAEATAPLSSRSAQSLATRLQAIVIEAGQPEAIDDGYETCPSRRIADLVPGYRKAAMGTIVAQRIGLGVLRGRCTHFATWLAKLEALGSPAPSDQVSARTPADREAQKRKRS